MVDLLDDDGVKSLLKEHLKSHKWWLIFPMDRIDVLEDIESSFYSGEGSADFVMLIGPQLPGMAIVLAKKSRMSPAMLAGKIGAMDYSSFHDRDVIVFGEPENVQEEARQIVAFSEWLGPIDGT